MEFCFLKAVLLLALNFIAYMRQASWLAIGMFPSCKFVVNWALCCSFDYDVEIIAGSLNAGSEDSKVFLIARCFWLRIVPDGEVSLV